MDKPGRNDLCHCGSGKKYKNCHAQIETKTGNSIRSKVIGAIVIGVMLLSIAVMIINSQSPEQGEAPPGKVWSEEHGHYH